VFSCAFGNCKTFALRLQLFLGFWARSLSSHACEARFKQVLFYHVPRGTFLGICLKARRHRGPRRRRRSRIPGFQVCRGAHKQAFCYFCPTQMGDHPQETKPLSRSIQTAKLLALSSLRLPRAFADLVKVFRPRGFCQL